MGEEEVGGEEGEGEVIMEVEVIVEKILYFWMYLWWRLFFLFLVF